MFFRYPGMRRAADALSVDDALRSLNGLSSNVETLDDDLKDGELKVEG